MFKLFSLLYLLLLLVSPAYGAITLDAVTAVVTSSNDISISASHTFGEAESNRAAFILHTIDSGTDVSTGCTIGGTAATLVTKVDGVVQAYIYRLLDPPTGLRTVECNSSQSDQLGMTVISLYGVDQTTPTGTPQTAIGSGTSSTLTVSDAANDDLILDVIGINDVQNLVVGVDQTERANLEHTTLHEYGASSQLGSVAGDAVSWTWDATEDFAHLAVAVKAAAAAVAGSGRIQVIVVTAVVPEESQVIPADLFASNVGSGTTCSKAVPCTSAELISQIVAGQIGEYLVGEYTGATGMIDTNGKSGTLADPITIRCEIPGDCLFNGQNARRTVRLFNADFWRFDGFNAKNCLKACFEFGTSADNNVLTRSIGWDSVDGDGSVFVVNNNTSNLLEDVAGFGIGRKTFATINATNLIIRRAFGRWEHSTEIGPKHVFTVNYNNDNVKCENCIGTWDETTMPGAVDQPYGILSMDRTDDNHDVSISGYFGSLAYILTADEADSLIGLARSDNDSCGLRFEHNYIYIEGHTGLKPFSMQNDPNCGSTLNKFLRRTTQVGGAASLVENQWNQSGNEDVDLVGSASNPFSIVGTTGARLCKKWVNGQETADGLFDQAWIDMFVTRLNAALVLDGRTPSVIFGGFSDLKAMLEGKLNGGNAIPAECT